MSTLPTLIDTLFVRLAWTTAQATVLIGVLWLLGRYLGRLSPTIRCMLWWLVAAQLLAGIVISTPVQLPWLSPSTHAVTTFTRHIVEPAQMGVSHIHATTDAPPGHTTWLASTVTWSWPKTIVALWLLGVLLQLSWAVKQWHESRALVRDSQPLRDAALQLLCAEQAHALQLRHIPHLRVSRDIVSPQVTGLWRPLVLLPAGQTLSTEELSMALAHELAHLRRGDLWLGWIPAIAQRLFFFHPLVSWAMREYAVYREAACDAQVLQRHHAAPQSYGHLLLRLGVAQPVHAGLAGASPTFQNLKRRLMLLQQSVNDSTSRGPGWLLVAAIALVGILPYRVTASSAGQAISATQANTADGTSLTVPPAPPAPPPLPAPPMPPTPPAPPAKANTGFDAHEVDIDTESNTSRGIVLLDGDTVMVNGDDDDLAHAQRLYKTNRSLLWIRRGNKAYMVRDANIIEQARSAYAPIKQLNREQGSFAAKEGELAGQQSGLAARQGALGARQAELESRRALIESERQENTAPQNGDAQEASIKGQLAALREEEAEINRENQQLDQDQKTLSEQQAALSHRASAMSQQAYKQLDGVLDAAIAKGLAEPVDR